jgi:hypothetical protein
MTYVFVAILVAVLVIVLMAIIRAVRRRRKRNLRLYKIYLREQHAAQKVQGEIDYMYGRAMQEVKRRL